ncbi:MAG TPA: carboxypeptidase regulatory-like domain-containing protein, partial [Gemmatimonadaceae bacterium]|nr:carboxypeptidase regulatory-like domain-containing protein [Gemmatimonadaceae bacterium]
VTGRVIDAATGLALSGAFVSAASNPNNPVSTDANGRFTLVGLTSGDDITVTRSSYAAVTQYNLRVVPADVVELPDIPMTLSGSAGTVYGVAVNALTDAVVAGATVKLFANIEPRSSDPANGVTSPAPVATTVTDATGSFAFASVPAGTYTIAVGAAGYALARVTTASVANASMVSRIALSPSFAGAGLRAVLTWGDCQASPAVPCDLDAHLTGPAVAPDTGRFHVAFFQRSYTAAGVPVAKLDNDAQTGVGPETVTLKATVTGAYKFYVHDATTGYDSTSTRLSASPRARVDVYSGTTLVATFFPPSGGAGTVWAVFEFDGTSLIPIGQMIRVQDFTKVGADF